MIKMFKMLKIILIGHFWETRHIKEKVAGLTKKADELLLLVNQSKDHG
jgi:hypothetical protein